MQHNPTFPPNSVSNDPLNKAVVRDIEEFCQHSSGLTANQQWLFNLPNGDRDSYTLHPQKPPPGLSLPNTGNAYLSQMHQNKYDNMSAERRSSQHTSYFPELSEVFRPQMNEMNSPCVDPYYENHYSQSSTKPNSTEQRVPKDINQLVSSFQSFMAGEHDSFCHGDFTNVHKQLLGMNYEDSTSPPMSTQSTPALQTQKQLVGDFGIVQREIIGGARKQTFKHNAFQGLPGFSPQNPDYLQKPKQFSGFINHPNQNNRGMYTENTPMSKSQYSKHHHQQGQMQNNIKSQLQKDKMMHMPVYWGDGIFAKPLTNTYREGEKKQTLTQNPYFDLQGRMQTHTFNRENSIVSVGSTQHFMPHMYPPDLKRHSSVPINSNFSSRDTLSYGSGAPGMDVGNMVSANDSTVFKAYAGDMMSHRGESTYHGMVSAVTAPLTNQGGPVSQFYVFLDECYEQWRCLEKERKRVCFQNQLFCLFTGCPRVHFKIGVT